MATQKDDQAKQPTMAPGDQVPPGTPGAGPNVCPDCGGKGRLQNGSRCETCQGTGTVVEAVGGGG
jgi:hypothetical protein